jgi:hypothetical protein
MPIRESQPEWPSTADGAGTDYSNPEWRLFYARPIYGSGFRHQLTGCSSDRSCVKHVRYSNDGYHPSSTRSIFCAHKRNKAQGFRSQVLCAGRGRGGSHSIRRDYDVALLVHICRLSGRKPAARSSSFNRKTLWRQFLYFGWSTPCQRMAPTEIAERKIVDGATNHYRRRARYGCRAQSPEDAPTQRQSVETTGTGNRLLDKIACNPAAGPRERKDFPIDSAFSCKQLQTKNSALV